MSDGSKFFWWERLDGVPNGKPEDTNSLTWQERVVLMEYMRAASGDLSSIFIGPAAVGRRLGVDARQVRRVRDRLARKGWLVLEERGGMRDGRKFSNLYRLGDGPTTGTEYPQGTEDPTGNKDMTTGTEDPGTQGSEYPSTSTYTSPSTPFGFVREKEVEGSFEKQTSEAETKIDPDTGEVLDPAYPFPEPHPILDAPAEDEDAWKEMFA